jgi:hypothetical protein
MKIATGKFEAVNKSEGKRGRPMILGVFETEEDAISFVERIENEGLVQIGCKPEIRPHEINVVTADEAYTNYTAEKVGEDLKNAKVELDKAIKAYRANKSKENIDRLSDADDLVKSLEKKADKKS